MNRVRQLRFGKFEYGLAAVIALLIIVRCAVLPISPPQFYMDESAGAAHIANMVVHGTNAYGQQWPLYSPVLGGGYITPVYLYPAVAWSAVFGFSEISLRYFSEVSTIIAVLLMAYGIRLWTDKRTGLIAACVGLALPWGWLQGSLAWDPALVPLFVSIAFVAFSLLLFHKSVPVKRSAFVVFPLALLLLAYLYPPDRVTAPLLFIAGYWVLYAKKIISLRGILLTALGSAIFSLPLLHFMLQPSALHRAESLVVFQQLPFVQAVITLIGNFLQLLNPWFLFVTGDSNLRHSTGFQGMLGWAMLPAVLGLVGIAIHYAKTRKLDHRLLIAIALFGVCASILGSALTNEGQPHSLRATAAWPFWLITLTIGWRWILASKNKVIIASSLMLFAVATLVYAADYTSFYPSRSGSSFDHDVHEKIVQQHETPPYPDLSMQYYKLR